MRMRGEAPIGVEGMKAIAVATLAIFLGAGLGGCVVERIGPPGVGPTRPITVKPRDVRVFADTAAIPGRYAVVEEIWIRDDGEELPRVLEDRLREKAGTLGANAIVFHPQNRRENGTRIDLGVTLDDPFDYFRATAVWLGEGQWPEILLR